MKKILSKIKNKLSKAILSKKTTKVAKAISREERKENFAMQQTVVEQTKFYTPQGRQPRQVGLKDLPYSYGRDKIVLQVRDPLWIHAYWEVSDDLWEKLKSQLKDEFYRAKRVLRVYDISQIIFNGSNAHYFFDIQINDHANNWYIETKGPGRSWCADLGFLLSDGKFVTIVRSNTVHTPLDGPSWITDEEWMIPEDMFSRLYGLGIGFGSSPVRPKKLWEKRISREISSGAVSSISSPIRKVQERGFWLAVNTELIVYGATDPRAKLTVQDREVKLKPDGTFSLRFALADGKQVIPVKAVSPDKKEERTITPIVTRETR